MMTAQRLVSLAERGEWEGLLAAVLGNGRPVPLSVRLRLGDEAESYGADPRGGVAMGLALCRAVELTYLPAPESASLAALLSGVQRTDGWFGSAAATACAVAGLRAYESQLSAGSEAADLERVALASDAAMHALITRMQRAGVGKRSTDRTDLAIILWALAGRTRPGEQWWIAERLGEAESLGLSHDASLSPVVIPALARSRAMGVRGVAA